ncbi:MAG: cysteine desulfurase [Clostridia bacterium]|nr:cysteine desulfurase [Clostridia bacterium]
MIYLDNSATTQTRVEVAKLVAEYSINNYFNPSSVYVPAINVKLDIDNARKRIMALLGVTSGKVIFTGSATEANNLVLNGLARKNKKIVISNGEHPSVFEVAKNLQNLGYMVEFVALNPDGTINLDDLASKVDENTGLVSVIHISNETGAVNDIAKISYIVKSRAPDCLVHCDGVQAFGKLKINLLNADVDLYTISSHKIHGPKGVAGLYFRDSVNLKPHILGGGQEGGLRSGTENPAGILGFTLACELMYEHFEEKRAHIRELKQYFIASLQKTSLQYIINGNPENCLENVLSVSFLGVRGEVLLHCLEKYEIYVSTGSACSSKHVGNRVLSSMGLAPKQMEGNIRFSFSEFNTKNEIDIVVKALQKEIRDLLS